MLANLEHKTDQLALYFPEATAASSSLSSIDDAAAGKEVGVGVYASSHTFARCQF